MKSFYEFLIASKNPYGKDPLSRLANLVAQDIAFPKQSQDFDEISSYLEHSGHYGKLLVTFDEAWQSYQYANQ